MSRQYSNFLLLSPLSFQFISYHINLCWLVFIVWSSPFSPFLLHHWSAAVDESSELPVILCFLSVVTGTCSSTSCCGASIITDNKELFALTFQGYVHSHCTLCVRCIINVYLYLYNLHSYVKLLHTATNYSWHMVNWTCYTDLLLNTSVDSALEFMRHHVWQDFTQWKHW